MTVNQATSSKRPEKLAARVGCRDSKSIYDRLYSTSTASSKARKEVAPVVPKNILMRENEDPASTTSVTKPRNRGQRPKKPLPTSNGNSGGAVFSRLYEKGTASSVSKRSNVESVSADSGRAPMKPKNQL